MMREEFLRNATLYHKYQKDDNIKMANIHAKKMYNIISSLKKNHMYEDFVDDMMFCKNDMACIWACGVSIDCNYRKKEAINILKKLSNSQDEIIYRSAKMSLRIRCNIPI